MRLRRNVLRWLLMAALVLLPVLVLRASLSEPAPSTLTIALLRITAPLEAAVAYVVEGVGSLWSGYVALVDIEAENRELRSDNARLRRQLEAMTRRTFDVQALEDLATVKRRMPADTLGARVIGAPMSPQFRVARIRIDRGQREVAQGMPVITGNGPVGRIDKVYGDYADVVLISDPRSSIEVVVPRTGGRGILAGLGKSDSYLCTIGWLEKQASTRVQVGDEIVTSGLGASFPAGLVVGKVSKVERDDGLFERVEVEPAVDVSRIRAVEVVLAPPPVPDPNAKAQKLSEPAWGGRVL